MQKLTAALASSLQGKGWSVVTEYELFREFAKMYLLPASERRQLYIRETEPTRAKFRRTVRDLRKARFIRPDADFYPASGTRADVRSRSEPSSYGSNTTQHVKVFRVSDIPDASAEEVSALVDPFCSISHLSAMQHYGLTDRRPRELMLTTLEPTKWKERRLEKSQADFEGVLLGDDAPVRLERIVMPPQLRKRPLSIHTTKRDFPTKPVREGHHRIPPVEEVFVQMLDRPDLCGGMAHVIEVWMEHAPDRLEKIVRAVEAAPEGILKVRAGFLLDECLNLKHPLIDGWTKFAQRGGSRRLEPSLPYEPRYSERWMISINVESESIPEKFRP